MGIDKNVGDSGCVASLVTELNELARMFSRSSTAVEFGLALQVVLLIGSTSAWRLIETERFTSTQRPLKRMLCFDSLKQVRRAIEARLTWDRADEEFRARHMTTPGGFPGVTADWVHTKDFDSLFGPSRAALRKELCVATASQTLRLR
jgi:hypothetical protein